MKDYTKDRSVPLPVAGLLNDMQRDMRPCTCFPDDWPPYVPCQHKFAFTECMAAAQLADLWDGFNRER